MSVTLAFDVYGTLIDTHGVVAALQKHVGDSAVAFSRLWRDKQLEYAFRRGLMQCYKNFAVCTRHALDYTCAHFAASLTEQAKIELMQAYQSLPAFGDVMQGLDAAKRKGFRLYAFSNGSAEAVDQLLDQAGISGYFADVVSTDELMSFKPNPAVYSHFLRRAGVAHGNAWLISSNPFDVIGAVSAGMLSAWVKRTEDALFDPWGVSPTITVRDLSELAGRISRHT